MARPSSWSRWRIRGRQPDPRRRKAPGRRWSAVKRRIVGYHQDEEDHWVADLECGHAQHVRHDPPWQVRPWVASPAGRASHLGSVLDCRRCEEPA
jgi:hypothetical protein